MKEKIALIYKIIIVLVSGVALYLNFKLMSIGTALLYFTNLSNLLCFLFFLVIVVLTITKKLKKNNFYYISKGMITMAITLTMFTYNLLIVSGQGFGIYDNDMLACNLAHIIVPMMIIFDYIVFSPKGNLKVYYPYIWSALLIIYQVVITIYGLLGGTFAEGEKYPYFYMSIEKYGIVGVLINYLVILVFFIGYGTIIQQLDNKIGKNKKK